MKTTILLLSVALMLMAQSTTVHVRELPPEPIPHGTCTQGHSGYLGVEESDRNRFTLSDNEVGEYVRSQIRQGYSLSLYPQVSGRIFAIAQCESDSANESHQSR
jgi:hypothetical protein